MRSKIHLEIKAKCIVILTILLILLLSNIVAVEGEELVLDVTNESYEGINEVYEGEIFLVSAYISNITGDIVPQIDVKIEFDGKPYLINAEDEGVISIKAPNVSKDTPYSINASKEGYKSAEKTLLVKNKKQLVVVPEKFTVKVNEEFSVKVTDENDNPVAYAIVAIQNTNNPPKSTDDNGRAWLTAPEDRDKIIIIAQKDGYINGKETILASSGGLGLEWLFQSQYTPIAIAVIAVIAAIVLVNLRQRKQIDVRTKEISKAQTLKQYSSQGTVVSMQPSVKIENQPVNHQYGTTENVDMESERGPKVEEIRISRPRKEKEIVPINAEEEKVDEAIPRKVRRRHEYDWFEGTDDIRYEIDKITGKIDEEGADKWFEGIDDIRAKIDEKVKKKDKKKNNQT
jgi:hypothetical protein